jgi:hypothetical protein
MGPKERSMPDLRDLLHDAAPTATRDVDMDAVRARVRQRARRRRALAASTWSTIRRRACRIR